MDVRPIRTEEDHQAALNEIEACWGAAEDTEEGDRLGVLLALVEAYEEKRWRFYPIDVLKNWNLRRRSMRSSRARACADPRFYRACGR